MNVIINTRVRWSTVFQRLNWTFRNSVIVIIIVIIIIIIVIVIAII